MVVVLAVEALGAIFRKSLSVLDYLAPLRNACVFQTVRVVAVRLAIVITVPQMQGE